MLRTAPTKTSERVRAVLAERGLLHVVDGVLAQHPGVTLDDVLDVRRTKPIAIARHHLYYELYETLGSLTMVGDLMERDHTTVMSGRREWALACGEVWALEARRRC